MDAPTGGSTALPAPESETLTGTRSIYFTTTGAAQVGGTPAFVAGNTWTGWVNIYTETRSDTKNVLYFGVLNASTTAGTSGGDRIFVEIRGRQGNTTRFRQTGYLRHEQNLANATSNVSLPVNQVIDFAAGNTFTIDARIIKQVASNDVNQRVEFLATEQTSPVQRNQQYLQSQVLGD